MAPARAGRLVGSLTVASLASACFCFLALVFGVVGAGADPGPEWEVPTERATEPAITAEWPACPDPEGPEFPYEGEDEVAAQVNHLRQESAATCRAMVPRLEEQVHRLWWVVTQLLGQQELAKLGDERGERMEGLAEVSSGRLADISNCHQPPPADVCKVALAANELPDPLPVSGGSGGGSVEGLDEVVTSVDATGEAVQQALWFIAGCFVASIVAYGLFKLWHRTT